MELRRHPRVSFQSLIRLKAPGQAQSVAAQVTNLSLLGAFVTTDAQDAPPEGAEVTCRFAVANEGRFVRGRVAWVRSSSRRTAVGIEFRGMDEDDRALLRRLVAPEGDPGQPADVWFEGMSGPVSCEATLVGRGLRLTARLPFLRPDSPVRLAVSDRPTDGPRDGKLRVARLVTSDEGGPELRLEVTLPVLASVQGTIEVSAPVRRGPAPQAPQASLVLDPVLTQPPEPRWLTFEPSEPATEMSAPGWRARVSSGWWPLVLGGLAGAALVAILLWLRAR
jgi:hypothetical protein